MNFYVGNLSFSTGNQELRTAFESFGQVDDARVVEDRESGRSRGFGFVEMPDSTEAEKAISALHETDFQGRNITVNEARPKREKSSYRY